MNYTMITKSSVDLEEIGRARPGGVIRVRTPSDIEWLACTVSPMAQSSAWVEEKPKGNCVNCGAPADEPVCSYCGTRHL